MPKPFFINSNKKIAEINMVDHAGEYGALKIYQSQLKYSKDLQTKKIIKEMLMQEMEHFNYFDQQLKKQKLRPTFFLPLWKILGNSLGAISALAGPKTAMLATEAIEEVIVNHYQEQIDYLEKANCDKLLLANLKKFKQDEASHIGVAEENGSSNAAGRELTSKFIKFCCKLAISLSKKI